MVCADGWDAGCGLRVGEYISGGGGGEIGGGGYDSEGDCEAVRGDRYHTLRARTRVHATLCREDGIALTSSVGGV
jgi:hypothetical protein